MHGCATGPASEMTRLFTLVCNATPLQHLPPSTLALFYRTIGWGLQPEVDPVSALFADQVGLALV
jgi:hypothetical protein